AISPCGGWNAGMARRWWRGRTGRWATTTGFGLRVERGDWQVSRWTWLAVSRGGGTFRGRSREWPRPCWQSRPPDLVDDPPGPPPSGLPHPPGGLIHAPFQSAPYRRAHGGPGPAADPAGRLRRRRAVRTLGWSIRRHGRGRLRL